MCFNVTFARLNVFARRHRSDLEDLQQEFGCGRGCGLCLPYVRAMLRSGRTEFELGRHLD